MYQVVYFEISGKCNAVCQWCATGIQNKKKKKGRFIPVDEFIRAVDHLRTSGLAGQDTVYKLFSWGEPFLHPKLKEILNFLNRENLKFSLSSNGSVPVLFNQAGSMANMTEIMFSMPGFSQKSYDKIHGFNIDKITTNITAMMDNYRACGFTGTAFLIFHIYQFNMDEIEKAVAFAQANQMVFSCGFAYINDWERYREYLTSAMDYKELKQASQDLFLHYVNDLLEEKKQVQGLACAQFNSLAIDENCNVVTCCILDKRNPGYVIGNLFELEPDQIPQLKTSQPVCQECDNLGIWYLVQRPIQPRQIFTLCDQAP